MKRLHFLIMAATAGTALLSSTATAQEYSNGGICKKGRKEATKTPYEAFGVHPPGIDPADARRCFHRWRNIFCPYYAPVSPVATSARWKPWCYFPLMPYYTPYYIGYCPKRLHNPKPAPYGSDGWGKGPMPCDDPNAVGPLPLNYGPYTSVIQDDTLFWRMGGNGLVPYGTPRPPHYGPPDIVDSIQVTRAQGGGFGPGCATAPDGTPVGTLGGPDILPPAETVSPKNRPANDQEDKNEAPSQPTEAEPREQTKAAPADEPALPEK